MTVKIAIENVLRDHPPLTRGMVIATPRARNLRGLAQAHEQLRRAGYSAAEIGRVAFCAAPGKVRSDFTPVKDPGVGESLIERKRQDWLSR